jgi:hypothetical protein
MPVKARAPKARTAASPAAAGVNGDAKDRVEGDGTDRRKIVNQIAAWLRQEHPEKGVDALAQHIAEDLFTDGSGRQANRLQLVCEVRGKQRREFGGWSPSALRDRVKRMILEAAR